jgi:hypothetical protein
MTKCVKPLRHLMRLSAKSSRSTRSIRTLHLDDLALLVAKCLSGFTHFVIPCDALSIAGPYRVRESVVDLRDGADGLGERRARRPGAYIRSDFSST